MIEPTNSDRRVGTGQQDVYLQLLNRVQEQNTLKSQEEDEPISAASTPERIVQGVVTSSYEAEQQRLQEAKDTASEQIKTGRLDVKV